MLIDQISLISYAGMLSPYFSTDSSYSLITGTSVLTSKSVPGLSGLCDTPHGLVAVIFVDNLPVADRSAGIMLQTMRKQGDENVNKWLVQVQQGSFAWQFMASEMVNGKGKPHAKAIFLRWKPGCMTAAIERHHNLVRALPEDQFLIGSDLERVATSTFMLSEGYSTIALTYTGEQWFNHLIENGGRIMLEDACIDAACCVDVEWTIDAQSMIEN